MSDIIAHQQTQKTSKNENNWTSIDIISILKSYEHKDIVELD